jgi:hypothetical protein
MAKKRKTKTKTAAKKTAKKGGLKWVSRRSVVLGIERKKRLHPGVRPPPPPPEGSNDE